MGPTTRAHFGSTTPPEPNFIGSFLSNSIDHDVTVALILDAVMKLLRDSGAANVLDLGCGSGALLMRLAGEAQVTRIVGLDTSLEALQLAESLLTPMCEVDGDRLSLIHGSLTTPYPRLVGFDAAAMVEMIEHVPPGHLSRVERAVFSELHPRLVIMTTPNSDYNVLYGLPKGQFRHADHEFEWTRPKFRSWATGVATRNNYRVVFDDIGPADPLFGSPTQMGIFTQRSEHC